MARASMKNSYLYHLSQNSVCKRAWRRISKVDGDSPRKQPHVSKNIDNRSTLLHFIAAERGARQRCRMQSKGLASDADDKPECEAVASCSHWRRDLAAMGFGYRSLSLS
ncbi:hypothetical protein Vretifemale_10594 [Volvox reticuliferus]|uniref:Uncharacterized protein n=1 Tax=Volvox reticuliferus TaxID=1737510 RepID=A0A8J4CEY1_9CHLO|nr:hypothetical protein Vretifemale_10594 [Volvox reticuliferus]